MIGLDTNVLVRYVAQDDPVQSPQATKVIEDALSREEGVFIPVVVLCETAWVLRGYYKLAKRRIIHVLDAIMAEKGFELEARVEMARALADYRHQPGDFADYAIGHIARHHRCSTVFTFDHGLIGSSLFRLIEKP